MLFIFLNTVTRLKPNKESPFINKTIKNQREENKTVEEERKQREHSLPLLLFRLLSSLINQIKKKREKPRSLRLSPDNKVRDFNRVMHKGRSGITMGGGGSSSRSELLGGATDRKRINEALDKHLKKSLDKDSFPSASTNKSHLQEGFVFLKTSVNVLSFCYWSNFFFFC